MNPLRHESFLSLDNIGLHRFSDETQNLVLKLPVNAKGS